MTYFTLDNLVYGVEPASFIDFPGYISTVLFLGGCNWRCPTCHNKNIAWYYNEMEAIPFDFVLQKLSSVFVDAVTITGGEPTISSNLKNLIDELSKKFNFAIKLDSNGSNPKVLSDLINKLDKIAVDIKGPFYKYPVLTGNMISEKQAKNNFEYIFELANNNPNKIYFRTTLVPQLSNGDLEEVKSYVKNHTHYFQEYLEEN